MVGITDVAAAIIGNVCRSRLTDTMTFEERMRVAMATARQEDWMNAGEPAQLKGAIAAVCTTYPEGDPQRLKLEHSWRKLCRLSQALEAMLQGVPVDLEAMQAEDERNPQELVPIMKYWHGEPITDPLS